MLWMILTLDDGDQKATRDRLLLEHRAYLDQNEHMIFFSGPQQTDDASANFGTLFVVAAPSREAAEAFIYNETFYKGGVFKEVRIARLRKGRYYPENVDK